MSVDPPDSSLDSPRFVLDGRTVSAANLPPTLTVLEYLRDVAHRTGTKEGCAEGDCGACTVVLGTVAPDGTRVDYRAINSCIRFLPTIDGHELVTVESLQDDDGSLHPVQQALVDHHASQCGFCTPGFVMSLFALYLVYASPTREQVVDALSGNLCRCTGYRPIIDAACHLGDYAEPAKWNRDAPKSPERRRALRSIARERALSMTGFLAPRSLEETALALAGAPGSLVLAGGTDVGLWVTKQLRELPPIVYLGEAAELKHVTRGATGLVIGAAVALTDAWDAIVVTFPQLRELGLRFGSPPVRNSGTLCGNLANGSPIGDSLPILIALDAELELRRGARTRRMPLDGFYTGYRRNLLEPGEFIVSVTVPPPVVARRIACYKLAKRVDQDISAVCAAFALDLREGRVADIRMVFGGMAPVVGRARAAERALSGAPWSADRIEIAAAALATDFAPLTDMRATGAYRLAGAANLLRRFHLEQTTPDAVLRTGALTGGVV